MGRGVSRPRPWPGRRGDGRGEPGGRTGGAATEGGTARGTEVTGGPGRADPGRGGDGKMRRPGQEDEGPGRRVWHGPGRGGDR